MLAHVHLRRAQAGRLEPGGQGVRIDRDESVPDMQDPHPQRRARVAAREHATRAQHSCDLGKDPILQLGDGTWCSIVKQTTAS